MIERIFKFFLILNLKKNLHWNDKKVKVLQRKPKTLGPFDVPLEMEVKILIPEEEEWSAKATITLDKKKVSDMAIELVKDICEDKK